MNRTTTPPRGPAGPLGHLRIRAPLAWLPVQDRPVTGIRSTTVMVISGKCLHPRPQGSVITQGQVPHDSLGRQAWGHQPDQQLRRIRQ
ncbi:MAG: hypothetical protein WB773_28320 [Isosphaeraceae bacterium]